MNETNNPSPRHEFISTEEIDHILNCMSLATAIALDLQPEAFIEVLAPHIRAGIQAGHHRAIIEKLHPERAAQIAAMMKDLTDLAGETGRADAS